jgi:type VI secretion system secreted protein Hcp
MMNAKALNRPFLFLAACLCLAGAGSALAAIDMFLKVDGIKGESTDKAHRDEIDVISWSWGVSAREEARAGKRGCVQGVSLTKLVDRATPPLVGAAALGTLVPRAVLTVRRPVGTSAGLEFLTLELNQVLVTAVQEAGSNGQDQFVEQVTLKADSMLVTYRSQNTDGSAGAPVTASVSGGC